jgi:hypothetical protein
MSQLTATSSPGHPAPNGPPRIPLPSFQAPGIQPPITSTFPKWNATSNRNTPKLKFPVTRTKQSLAQFLIATFRAFTRRAAASSQPAHPFSPTPGLIAIKSAHRKLEIFLTRLYSNTSKFLIDNFRRYLSSGFSNSSHVLPPEGPLGRPEQRRAASHRLSNRHTYEKLERELSHLSSANVLVLIDTKTHFVQGILSVFELRSIMPSRNETRAATGNSERH